MLLLFSHKVTKLGEKRKKRLTYPTINTAKEEIVMFCDILNSVYDILALFCLRFIIATLGTLEAFLDKVTDTWADIN